MDFLSELSELSMACSFIIHRMDGWVDGLVDGWVDAEGRVLGRWFRGAERLCLLLGGAALAELCCEGGGFWCGLCFSARKRRKGRMEGRER